MCVMIEPAGSGYLVATMAATQNAWPEELPSFLAS
jgi:hypothetical protein